MFRALFLIVALMVAVPAAAQPLPAGLDPANAVLLDTKHGRIVIKLRNDIAPGHAERIKTLVREKFYDNVPFHRVIAGFMAQTGDGQNGNGTGNSKYPNLRAEFTSTPFRRGVVGMARKGNDVNSANSQFFIMFAPASSLDGQYTIWGRVVSGMDVVDKIKRGGGSNGIVREPDTIKSMRPAAAQPAAPGDGVDSTPAADA